jgi:hypothetical protein
MRFHPRNIFGGSFSRTPAWSLLCRSSVVTSMIKQKHCRFLYGDLLCSYLESTSEALITSISRYICIFIKFDSVNSTKHFTIPNLAFCSKSGRGVSSVPKLHHVKNSAWCLLQTWIQTKPPDWPFSNHYRDVQVQRDKSVWIPLVTSYDAFWNIRNRIFAHGSHK